MTKKIINDRLFVMSESSNKLISKMIDALDENDLIILLQQIGKRILVLRMNTPDAPFWFNVLLRITKWLSSEPTLNQEECDLIVNPPEGINGKVKAIIRFRARTGMRLHTARDVVEAWMTANIKFPANNTITSS